MKAKAVHVICLFVAVAAAAAAVADAYSLSGTIINHTTYPMSLLDSNCTTGRWVVQPARDIPPAHQSAFATDGGFMGATGGHMTFAVGSCGPQTYFKWSIPTIGTSKYTNTFIPPNVVTYTTGKDASGTTVTVQVFQSFDDAVAAGAIAADASADASADAGADAGAHAEPAHVVVHA